MAAAPQKNNLLELGICINIKSRRIIINMFFVTVT